MAVLKQKLNRKNDSGTYDEIHLKTDATNVTLSPTDETLLSDEINSLKTSVSNGKSAVASAITDKGISTSATASFDTMANNIRSLQIQTPVVIPIKDKDFTYTGNCTVIADSATDWRIKFLTSGVFKWLNDTKLIDVFLVGGGGGAGTSPYYDDLGAAGGGYTKTAKNINMLYNAEYNIIVGEGGAGRDDRIISNGGNSIAFGVTANGGQSPKYDKYASGTYIGEGGDGGSGGGAQEKPGGSDGSDGTRNSSSPGGKGQGTTTREFGESTGDLYAGGGSGVTAPTKVQKYVIISGGDGGGGSGVAYLSVDDPTADWSKANGTTNTGGGGGVRGYGRSSTVGKYYGGTGGSGIVIIRNAR